MYTLYIGNRNYSTWSLRGWLVTKLSGAPFTEVQVQLSGQPHPDWRMFSPTERVPALHDGAVMVWDSLAIAEYLAERHPGMWPGAPDARAWARSVCAEMHSGFGSLRNDMTMCIRERVDVRPWSPSLAADIARVAEIWTEGPKQFGGAGPYLCGHFSIADAFYAPVAFRFKTYDVALDAAPARYFDALCAHPWLREWEATALAETARVEADEPRVVYRDKLGARR